MDRTSDSPIPNFSHSLSLPSEPPDIRNWFPSYQYESFVWDTYDDFGGSAFKESECEGDGCLLVGDRNGEKEGNMGGSKRNGSSVDKLEDQSLHKLSDSLSSSSLPSEPPHIRNWFPSYESPALDTNDDFKESFAIENESEVAFAVIEGSNREREEYFQESRNSGNRNEVGASEKQCSNGIAKIPDSPQSSLFPSEPPDVRNWYSYVYESPVLGESDELACEETECEEDNFVNQRGNKEKEMKMKKFGATTSSDELVDEKVQFHGFLKFNRSIGDDKLENQPVKKDNRVADKENSSTCDNLWCKKEQRFKDIAFPFPNQDIDCAKGVEKSSLNDDPLNKQQQKQNCPREAGFVTFMSNMTSSNNERKSPTELVCRKDFTANLEAEAQTKVDPVSTRSNVTFIQVTRASMETSPQGSNDKENGGKEASGNGFVTTRKGRMTRPNDENSLNRPQEILLECSRKKGTTPSVGEKDAIVKRRALSERTNFEHSAVNEVIGKWQCPQKSKPSVGPPLKQVRLEQWVRRL